MAITRKCQGCGERVTEADVRLGLAYICEECGALLCAECDACGHDCEV